MIAQTIPYPALEAEAPPLRWDGDIIRIGFTRVTLDSIISEFHRGETPEQIAQNFDSLTLGEIYGAISYYLAHQSEVEAYLAKSRQAHDDMRKELETKYKLSGIRERLMARKTAKS